jgi:hypothetical protein
MNPEQRFLTILWSAMTMAIVPYFVIAKIVVPPDPRPSSTLVTAMMAGAIALVAVSFAAKAKAPNPRTGAILAYALCDAAALLGVVTHFVTGSPDFYLMMLVGLAGMVLHFPRSTQLH